MIVACVCVVGFGIVAVIVDVVGVVAVAVRVGVLSVVPNTATATGTFSEEITIWISFPAKTASAPR